MESNEEGTGLSFVAQDKPCVPQGKKTRHYMMQRILSRVFGKALSRSGEALFTRTLSTLLLILCGASVAMADTDGAKALQSLKTCKEKGDAAACRQAIRLGLSPKLASEAYTFWADSLHPMSDLKDQEEYPKLLPKAIQLDPNNALATYLLGKRDGRFDYKVLLENMRLLRKAVELRPGWEGAHVNLATVLGQTGKFEEGIQELRRAVELAPDDPVYRTNYEGAKSGLDAARKKLSEAEEKAKADPKTMSVYVVEAAKWACDVPKAEEYAAKIESNWPSGGPRLLAEAYAACGQYDKARELFRKIVDGFEKRLDTGLTYNEAIQVQEQTLQFLELIPEATRLNLLKATQQEREGKWWIALSYLQNAERAGPTAEIYARLAVANLKAYGRGNEGTVMQEVEKGLELDPKLLEKHPELKPYAPAGKKQ